MFSCHFMNSNGSSSVLRNLNHFFYRRYVDDIFVFFESAEHLSIFRDYFNTCHPNISFCIKEGQNGKVTFLDVRVSREKGKFATTNYRKPTFSGVYIHFESFLTIVCNGYMVIWYGLCSWLLLFGLSFLKIVF